MSRGIKIDDKAVDHHSLTAACGGKYICRQITSKQK